MHPLDDHKFREGAKHKHHATGHPHVQSFHVGYGRNVSASEHRDQSQHAGDQQRDAARNGVQAEPEAEPRQLDDQRGRRERLNEVMPDLALEAEKEGEARKVSFFRHIVLALLERERRS